LNTHLKELIALSQNDQAIDSYTPTLQRLEKKVVKAQKKLDTEQESINKVLNEIERNEEKIKSFEEQLTLLNEKLTQNNKKSKKVINEKEIKALSIEDNLAKEKMNFANEEIDRLQNINDTKKEILSNYKEEITVLQDNFTTINSEVSKKTDDINKDKSELFIKRETLTRNLEQKVLAFYEKIRIWAGNTAVVPVKKQACYGCYMKLNDKTYSEVIKGAEICNCPHCGRIIYIETIED
jgi:predicted  nucleic acid-binding Zn-ribbon protein